jgi:hypothetical protein
MIVHENRIKNMPSIPTLSTKEWREDLNFFAKELTQRHKNPYHRVTQEAFEQAVAELHAQIPTLKDYEIVVGIERLAAMIGDGHTRLNTRGLFHFFPFEVFWFERELRIIRTTSAYRHILGTRIAKVGGIPIANVWKRLQTLIPQGENKWYTLDQSAYYITRVEPLAALGILPEVDTTLFTLKADTGKKLVLHITPVSPSISIEWTDAIELPPLYLQRLDEGFWFSYLPDSHTIYVCFRRYDNLEENAKKLWDFVDSHSPNRLIIDMRQNSGGNYALGREHLIYNVIFRRGLNNKGHLFVIAGRQTFSAAMTNITDFRRETDAIIVGEPIGARPNGYQELDRFTLPNSQLQAFCSILYYKFMDRDVPAILPDKRIDPDWTAYKAGRDPVMEWIMTQS